MSSPVSRKRLVGASVACALLWMALSADLASARTYTVVSCDAGLGTALSAEGWMPQTTIPGSSYAVCPSTGGDNTGISDRITQATGAGLNFSAHNFTAPAGTRITGLRWGGRFARGNCAWGALVQAFPSGAALLGVRPNTGCAVSGLDVRTTPLAVPVPAGTTRLQQIVVCGATGCQPGATMHTTSSVVTIDDPTLPSVSASGALVSGRWVRGVADGDGQRERQHRGRADVGDCGAADGIEAVAVSVHEPSALRKSQRSNSNPDRTYRERAVPRQRRRPGRRRECAAVAYDARVDNEPPGRVRPAVAGGEGWRRTNRFTVAWQNPVQAHAPIVRAWYRLCGPDACAIAPVAAVLMPSPASL